MLFKLKRQLAILKFQLQQQPQEIKEKRLQTLKKISQNINMKVAHFLILHLLQAKTELALPLEMK